MVAAESGIAMVRGGLGCGEKEAGRAEEAVEGSMSGGKSAAEVESIVLFGVVGGGSIAVCIRTEDGWGGGWGSRNSESPYREVPSSSSLDDLGGAGKLRTTSGRGRLRDDPVPAPFGAPTLAPPPREVMTECSGRGGWTGGGGER